MFLTAMKVLALITYLITIIIIVDPFEISALDEKQNSFEKEKKKSDLSKHAVILWLSDDHKSGCLCFFFSIVSIVLK